MPVVSDYVLDITEFDDPTDATAVWKSTTSNITASVDLDADSYIPTFNRTARDFDAQRSVGSGVVIFGAGSPHGISGRPRIRSFDSSVHEGGRHEYVIVAITEGMGYS